MELADINLMAVLVASAAYFAVGAVWYSPVLFAKQWQKELGKKEKDLKDGATSARSVGGLTTLISVYVLAWFFDLLNVNSAVGGAITAAWIALGFVITNSLMHAAYHGVSKKLWLINNGYNLLGFVVAGAVLGGWQ